MTDLIAIRVRFAFLILFSTCGFQLSLSSSVTPRYLAVVEKGIDWPYSFSPAGIWYDVGLFVVKSMTTVFSALN
jgi:hypothetical protein